MKIKDLISFGYFSEELPPPFNSIELGNKILQVQSFYTKLSKAQKKDIRETIPSKYSIPKVGMHRRYNEVPNPINQVLLSEYVCNNWAAITRIFKTSKLSASIPDIDKTKRRAVLQFSKFEEFKEKCITVSFDKLYELKTDISKYFPSIYTHSIPWAVHGKAFAKLPKNRIDRTLFGNLLDEAIRNGQSGQTKGIPIGTDTSRIIAEILGCTFDFQLLEKLKNENISIRGFRFVDDCHFYFSNRSDAETALKIFQNILKEYSLEINEEKTHIIKAPYCFENNWNHHLNTFVIRDDPKYQKLDIRNYCNLLIKLSLDNPKDSVFKYGIKRLVKIKIQTSNWGIFESLIYRLSLAEPSILPDLLKILLVNKSSLDRKKLQSFVETLLNQNIYKGNNFEVCWALWIAKSLNIKIPTKIAQEIIYSLDAFSIIVLLDLRANKLAPQKLDFKQLLLEFTKEGLLGNLWILVYEATIKGWIKFLNLSQSPYFDNLNSLTVSFYNPSRQIKYTIPIIPYKKKILTKVSKPILAISYESIDY